MYEEAIQEIPDEEWSTGNIQYLTPSRILCHVIETAEFYSQNSREFKWGHRFGIDHEKAPPESLPSKDQMMTYHKEVKEKIVDWLGSMDDETLLSKETVFTWTGSTILSRVLYIDAHYRQHFGEINAELRHRGLDRIKWKTY